MPRPVVQPGVVRAISSPLNDRRSSAQITKSRSAPARSLRPSPQRGLGRCRRDFRPGHPGTGMTCARRPAKSHGYQFIGTVKFFRFTTARGDLKIASVKEFLQGAEK